MVTTRGWNVPSRWTRLRRGLLLGAVIAVVVAVIAPATSLARASTGKFHFVEGPSTDTFSDFPCFDGVAVVMTSTLTRTGRFTETQHHLSFHGTNVIDYRVAVADGSRAVGQVIDHFNFVFNLNRPRSIVSSTQHEKAIVYSPKGDQIGTITVKVTHHLTYADLNGNFEPDPGEITVEVDKGKVTCA